MLSSGKTTGSGESLVQVAEEFEEGSSRKRMAWIAVFVILTVAASLAAYLLWRPANRHLEPTPYEALISQLRKDMSADDVLALFRSASDGNARAEVKAYDELSASGPRHVVSYRIGSEEPLTVRLGGPGGRTATEWCYRDHCYDNIE
jgi:hypothetical protein